MPVVLVLAGAYNLAWGAWAVLLPPHSFAHSGLSDPGRPLNYPQLWQCVGMLVGLYGLGYLLAARDPVRYWPVVLVGFLSKCSSFAGIALGVAAGQSPPASLAANVPNDVIWIVPFALVLLHARRESRGGQ
jgi:hypothetical protein